MIWLPKIIYNFIPWLCLLLGILILIIFTKTIPITCVIVYLFTYSLWVIKQRFFSDYI